MEHATRVISADRARAAGFTGRGITVAVIDTGLFSHPDIDCSRVLAFRDFVNGKIAIYDDSGHGTHVCGILGGSGKKSGGRYRGIAPECNYVIIKGLDEKGDGKAYRVIEAMNWVRRNRERYGIRILNLSFGADAEEKDEDYFGLIDATESLWEAGVCVVAAAGNKGPVTVPGCSKRIITVGATELTQFSHSYSESFVRGNVWKKQFAESDIKIPKIGLEKIMERKPDVAAPAIGIVSTDRNGYRKRSGTSMATPMVSGAIALLLQKEPRLMPDEIKRKVQSACEPLRYRTGQLGYGSLNVAQLLGI